METQTVSATPPAARPSHIIPAERRAHGKSRRDAVARNEHAGWRAPPDRADPIGILRAADATRQPDLVPLRYGRMLQSPFTFYRGSAGVMAADLARTPVSGINVQVCGDCHLMNFGGFATPERQLIFDINDAATLSRPGTEKSPVQPPSSLGSTPAASLRLRDFARASSNAGTYRFARSRSCWAILTLSSGVIASTRATRSSFASSAALALPKARSRIELHATAATRSSSLSISSMSRRTAWGAARWASFIAVPYSPEFPDGLPDCPGLHRFAARAGGNARFGAPTGDPTDFILPDLTSKGAASPVSRAPHRSAAGRLH